MKADTHPLTSRFSISIHERVKKSCNVRKANSADHFEISVYLKMAAKRMKYDTRLKLKVVELVKKSNHFSAGRYFDVSEKLVRD